MRGDSNEGTTHYIRDRRATGALRVTLKDCSHGRLQIRGGCLRRRDPTLRYAYFRGNNHLLRRLHRNHRFSIIVLYDRLRSVDKLRFLVGVHDVSPGPGIILFSRNEQRGADTVYLRSNSKFYCINRTRLGGLL